MNRPIDLLKRMYLTERWGRIALFCFLLLWLIPLLHLFGGPPPLSELRLVDGTVAKIEAREGLQRAVDVTLFVADGAKVEEIRYLANPGDGALEELMSLEGAAVRAWVETTYELRIYQLESGSRHIVDYATRYRQLTGDPATLQIYFAVVLGVFVLISYKRYSEAK